MLGMAIPKMCKVDAGQGIRYPNVYILYVQEVLTREIYFLYTPRNHLSDQHTECPKIYRKSELHPCLSITQIYTKEDAVQICGKFWDTQYICVHAKEPPERPIYKADYIVTG